MFLSVTGLSPTEKFKNIYLIFFPTERHFCFHPESCWIVYWSVSYEISSSSAAVKCIVWLSNVIINAFLLLLIYQWWERDHCSLRVFLSHFWIFLETCIKCPIFNGPLWSLHDIEEREGIMKVMKSHVQALSFFLHLVIASTFLSPCLYEGKTGRVPVSNPIPGWFKHSGSAGADLGPWWVTRSEEVQITPSKVGLGTNLKMKKRTWEKQLSW